MKQHIAIIGAGYAGLAAGVDLAENGYTVTIFESAKTLGGRARAVTYEQQILDNGQHICLGAYTDLLAMIKQVGLQENAVFLRQPLDLNILPDFRFTLPSFPAPWHLLTGLWQAQGLSWGERWQIAKLITYLRRRKYSLPYDQTVISWLQNQGQSAHLIGIFWTPLCLAALNTPISIASAQILAYVLRDSVGGHCTHSDLLLPTVDLSHLFPYAAARFIQQRQGHIYTATRVQSIQPEGRQWRVDDTLFDQVIIAVAPQQLTHLALPAAMALTIKKLAQWPYQAIATVYLQYTEEIRLAYSMQGLSRGLGHWVFDRGQTHAQAGLIAVVISALPKNTDSRSLVQCVRQELQQFFNIHAVPIWYKVIIEKRATFSAEVNMQRPTPQTTMPGLWLAGDYTVDYYPATLEGAVRSGKHISQLIIEKNHG